MSTSPQRNHAEYRLRTKKSEKVKNLQKEMYFSPEEKFAFIKGGMAILKPCFRNSPEFITLLEAFDYPGEFSEEERELKSQKYDDNLAEIKRTYNVLWDRIFLEKDLTQVLMAIEEW